MSDVVVHVTVSDIQSETKFVAAVEAFAKTRSDEASAIVEDSPTIMVKTIMSGNFIRKAVVFPDRRSATEFLSLWRRQKNCA